LSRKIEILQIQDGGRMPYCNRLLAIYRHNIRSIFGQLMRNLERR